MKHGKYASPRSSEKHTHATTTVVDHLSLSTNIDIICIYYAINFHKIKVNMPRPEDKMFSDVAILSLPA